MTHPHAAKAAQVADALRDAGIKPVLMIHELPDESWVRAQASAVRSLVRAAFARGPKPRTGRDAAEYARLHDIEQVGSEDLNAPAFIAGLKERSLDMLIHAGAGILREPLLRVPRLGTLNAHMGLLPAYRGMNVAEWAALNADPVGCTVHLIDAGIDTGAVLATRNVPIHDVRSIAELRARVNAAQLQLLAEVVADTARTGNLPPLRPQTPLQGRQYFAMHAELRAILERRLARASTLASSQ